MADLVGHPEDRFSRVAAHIDFICFGCPRLCWLSLDSRCILVIHSIGPSVFTGCMWDPTVLYLFILSFRFFVPIWSYFDDLLV